MRFLCIEYGLYERVRTVSQQSRKERAILSVTDCLAKALCQDAGQDFFSIPPDTIDLRKTRYQ